MNRRSLDRISEVHPLLRERVLHLNKMLAFWDGTLERMEVTQGLRSYATQDTLYAQGRTAPGKIITKAPGGYSWHNYGLAVDVAPYHGAKPDWKLSNPMWPTIADLAPANGLFSGSKFIHMVDWPHLQLEEIPRSPTAEHRQAFKDAGLEAVWVDLKLPVEVQEEGGS